MADTLYAWLVEEEDGREGIIAALIPGLGNSQLVTAFEGNAQAFRPLAEAHGKATGRPVRLGVFRDISSPGPS